MRNLLPNDFKNIKLTYERIPEERGLIKVNIYWKQDTNLIDAENIEVYAETGSDKGSIVRLQRLENSKLWHASVSIRNTLSEVCSFDKKLIIKLVQSRTIPYRYNYSYAS